MGSTSMPEGLNTTDDPDQATISASEVDTVIQTVRQAAKVEIGTEGEEEGDWQASYYWDASTMSPLNAASLAAIARLRAYKPPAFPIWDRLPASRRAAVLLLLYADRKGDLRVVITMRAASLRSFSGHAALPGGKADDTEETPYQIARREAWEEIGLPMDDNKLPVPFKIEHLCDLPFNLARTELAVRPCVALLHTNRPPVPTDAVSTSASTTRPEPTAEESLIPRLDAKEVAAVFSAPLHNFLRSEDEVDLYREGRKPLTLPPGKWYDGYWTNWHEHPWRVHFFYVPVVHQHVAKPFVREGGLASISEEEPEKEPGRYKVWGMTARILVDAAKVAYAETPEFEHNDHAGDEEIIMQLEEMGKLTEKKRVTVETETTTVVVTKEGGEGGGAKM